MNWTELHGTERNISGLNLTEPNETELTCREHRTEQNRKYVNVTKGTQHSSSIGSFHPLYLPDPPRSLLPFKLSELCQVSVTLSAKSNLTQLSST